MRRSSRAGHGRAEHLARQLGLVTGALLLLVDSGGLDVQQLCLQLVVLGSLAVQLGPNERLAIPAPPSLMLCPPAVHSHGSLLTRTGIEQLYGAQCPGRRLTDLYQL